VSWLAVAAIHANEVEFSWHQRCRLFHDYSDFDWLFAFGQVRRSHRLAGVELVFQRDDFGSDVTTGGRGLLESVVTGESGHHVRMSGHEDPQADPRDLRSGVYEGDRFQFSATPNCVISQVALV
jgi:hypothetical protein